MELPPGTSWAEFRRLLPQDVEDAAQDAHVAYLESLRDSPGDIDSAEAAARRAVNRLSQRIQRHRDRYTDVDVDTLAPTEVRGQL